MVMPVLSQAISTLAALADATQALPAPLATPVQLGTKITHQLCVAGITFVFPSPDYAQR